MWTKTIPVTPGSYWLRSQHNNLCVVVGLLTAAGTWYFPGNERQFSHGEVVDVMGYDIWSTGITPSVSFSSTSGT